MPDARVAEIELHLLLEALNQGYGQDFRRHAQASLEHRARAFAAECGCAELSGLVPRVLHDPPLAARLCDALSASSRDMFHDPAFHLALRQHVVPVLRTWPRVKAWLPGCGSGEEAYALSILLEEEGLGERATLYATDGNAAALQRARDGIYPVERVRAFSEVYRAAGGKRSFSDCFHARYGAAVMAPELRARIVFSTHDLAVDGTPGEMHLVVCRDVLMFFNAAVRDRATVLFADSLIRGGFLAVGTREDLSDAPAFEAFRAVDAHAGLFKRVAGA